MDDKLIETFFISSLLTSGNGVPQKSHIHGSSNIGCPKDEFLEIALQILLYRYFPMLVMDYRLWKRYLKRDNDIDKSIKRLLFYYILLSKIFIYLLVQIFF